VFVESSELSHVLMSADTVPTNAEHYAWDWGGHAHVSISPCATKQFSFDAIVAVRCWSGCTSAVVNRTITTELFDPSQVSATLSTELLQASLTVTNTSAGVMAYAFVAFGPEHVDSTNHVRVEVVSPPAVSVDLRAKPQPNEGPANFFVACPSARPSSTTQRVSLGPRQSAAVLLSAPPTRGMWLGFTTWNHVASLTVNVSLGNASCAELDTSALGFCSQHLPATVTTPDVSWRGDSVASMSVKDDRVRSTVEVIQAYVPPPCASSVAHHLCAQAFPACDDATVVGLPVCEASCTTIQLECSSYEDVVGNVLNLCADESSVERSTCYGPFSHATIPRGASFVALLVVSCVAWALH